MPTPDPHGHTPNGSPPDGSLGYEPTDVNVRGIIIFLISLGVFVGVFFVFCFGMGKVINTAIAKHDGPRNKWNAELTPTSTRSLTSNATMEQEELRQMTQRFPTPRMQTDDGDQDVADLHAREDLLLDHYSWIDRQQGKVRIPISRAMQLLAQYGLPVAPPRAQSEPLMTADKAPEVTPPLTNGFARTGYEQQQLATIEQERSRGEKPGERAALGAGH
ncbi:MAG TPA: hypothetical protein VGM27_13085 [Acidobacteriaceae bacterium]|jgi:hypothetical protein